MVTRLETGGATAIVLPGYDDQASSTQMTESADSPEHVDNSHFNRVWRLVSRADRLLLRWIECPETSGVAIAADVFICLTPNTVNTRID